MEIEMLSCYWPTWCFGKHDTRSRRTSRPVSSHDGDADVESVETAVGLGGTYEGGVTPGIRPCLDLMLCRGHLCLQKSRKQSRTRVRRDLTVLS